MGFREVDPRELTDNPVRIIGDDWMLVTAGTPDDWNTMTASWGSIGVLWHEPVVFAFVRPRRHTYGFMERSDHYTLTFFDESYKDTLMYCGTHSGKDVDKAKETGLTPMEVGPSMSFEEARLVILGRKWYTQDIDRERFLDPAIDENYEDRSYHRMYVGRIEKVLVRD